MAVVAVYRVCYGCCGCIYIQSVINMDFINGYINVISRICGVYLLCSFWNKHYKSYKDSEMLERNCLL